MGMKITDLTKEELQNLLADFSKRWLAHDGLWFLEVEKRDGLEKAMEIDRGAWEKFTVLEGKRIMKFLGMKEGGGLEALETALDFRLYACINEQETEREGEALIFKMKRCRVQTARERKGLTPFPCKEIGWVEYAGFATTIDPRIETTCIQCPPDRLTGDYYCGWKFVVQSGD